jgi:hypothetical protein
VGGNYPLNLKIFWSSADILINEGTTSQISLKNSSRQDCNWDDNLFKLSAMVWIYQLCADVNKKSISTFVKIRISNSNLNIEKGRYLNTGYVYCE